LVFSTGFAVIGSEVLPFAYLYHLLTAQDFADYLALRAKGSAYPAVSAADFENAEVVVPEAAAMHTFHERAAPLLELKENLRRKNGMLRRTRDLLLPRLISGEIDMLAMQDDLAGASAG
jgi:type I restriction enzyme S subunit